MAASLHCRRSTGGEQGEPGIPERSAPIPLTAARPQRGGRAPSLPQSCGRRSLRPRRSLRQGHDGPSKGQFEDRSLGQWTAPPLEASEASASACAHAMPVTAPRRRSRPSRLDPAQPVTAGAVRGGLASPETGCPFAPSRRRPWSCARWPVRRPRPVDDVAFHRVRELRRGRRVVPRPHRHVQGWTASLRVLSAARYTRSRSSISSAKAGNPPGCHRTRCAATPQAAPVTGSPLPNRRPTLGRHCPPAAEPPLGPAEPAPHASRAQPSSPSRPPPRRRLPVARLPQGKPDCR